MMKTQTYNYSVAAAYYDSDSRTVEILPVENLPKSNSIIKDIDKTKPIDITKLYEDGSFFFYKLENYELDLTGERYLASYEKGFGNISVKNGKQILDRAYCFEQYLGEEILEVRSKDQFLDLDNSTHLIITTYQPSEFIDLCIVPLSVMATRGSFNANPVHIEEYSLLGRNQLEISSIKFSDVVSHGLSNIKNKISTPSNAFELTGGKSMFISRSFVAKPSKSRPQNPRKGQIIFNERIGCFEGYNGSEWKSLQWGKN